MAASHKDALLSATKSLLWDHGYEAMSPRRILDESGAGQGSLYHHFSGKQDLATHALREVSEELKSEFDELFDPKLPPLERVQAFLGKKRPGTKGSRLGRLANEPILSEEEIRQPVNDYMAHVEKQIARALKEAVRDGSLAKGVKPKTLAATLVATVQGGYVLSLIYNDPKHVNRATKGALGLLQQLASN